MLLCLLISMGSMWFWWLNVSVIDIFTSVTDVLMFILHCVLKKCIFFKLHFFTLNHNYLTIFYLIFVLVTIIYLVCYIFICFIYCFFNIYLFFEPFSFNNCDIILYPILYTSLHISTWDIKLFLYIVSHIILECYYYYFFIIKEN